MGNETVGGGHRYIASAEKGPLQKNGNVFLTSRGKEAAVKNGLGSWGGQKKIEGRQRRG